MTSSATPSRSSGPFSRRPGPALLAGAVVALVAIGFLGLRGPTDPSAATSPDPATSSGPVAAPPRSSQDAGIDSVRLLTTLSVLAHDSMEGRRVATAGGARARAFLVASLDSLHIPPLGAGHEHPFPVDEEREGVNLLGLVPGAVDAPYIVLSGHYDHVGVRDGTVYNGADDNASGAAVVLEIARILMDAPPRHPVVIALFDGEEGGLRGARAFVADPPIPLDEIGLNVNLDMVARTSGLLWAGGAFHTPALRPILESAAEGAPVSLRLGRDRPNAPEGDDWTGQSDHGAFHEAGIPFVYFGVDDHPDYHRPTDDVERVDPGEYVASARTILRALRALDAALPLSAPEGLR